MAIHFHCPSCKAKRSASEGLAGRKVRCPDCDAMVEVPAVAEPIEEDDERGTVAIDPDKLDATKTVMLEAVDVVPETVETPPSELAPIEVTEVVAPPPQQTARSQQPPKNPKPPAEEEDDHEGMPRGELEETEMDMTPMVDVTFLLLIFFMVTAAFTLQKSIHVPKPESDQASTETTDEEPDEGDRVTVQIDEFNTYHVMTIDWEEEAPSEHELLQHLRTARDGDSSGQIPSTLLVEANEESLHEKVVSALDAGGETGFENVMLATVEAE